MHQELFRKRRAGEVSGLEGRRSPSRRFSRKIAYFRENLLIQFFLQCTLNTARQSAALMRWLGFLHSALKEMTEIACPWGKIAHEFNYAEWGHIRVISHYAHLV